MDIAKQIQHYRMTIRWQSNHPFDYSDPLCRVAVFAHLGGGRWSDNRLTLEDAVTECMEKNRLEIVK